MDDGNCNVHCQILSDNCIWKITYIKSTIVASLSKLSFINLFTDLPYWNWNLFAHVKYRLTSTTLKVAKEQDNKAKIALTVALNKYGY